MSKVKIVALNSGGLDSVVLMHFLKEMYGESVEVHTLFFDYEQKALTQERIASKKVSDKLGYKWTEIKIEPFKWSSSSLVNDIKEDYSSLYLEMRNMIFISYATSYAQSIGAVKVYCALIKPPKENPYPDATPEFSNSISRVMQLCNLELCTPFITSSKQVMLQLSRKYGIKKEDFCSCYHTEKTSGEKCSNCELLEEYSMYFDPYNDLEDTFFRGGDYESVRKSGVIDSAKISLNNSCNLSCPYCLMTGVDHTEKNVMSPFETIAHLYSLGIRNIDLFGKEPLYDDTAVEVLDYFKEYKDLNFTLITNGKNLEKYADSLISSQVQSITVSHDGGVLREFTVPDELIQYIVLNGKPISISLDIHNKNWFMLNRLLTKFYDLGVSSVYVKPIEDWGGCDKSYSISEDLYASIIDEVENSAFNIPETTFYIPFKHPKLTHKYSDIFKYDIPRYSNRPVSFSLDPVCTSGYNSVFVNYDSKVYGCGNCAYERPKTGVPLSQIHNYKELKEAVSKFKGRNCCNPID